MSMFQTGPQPVTVVQEDGTEVQVLYGDGRTKQAFKAQCDINNIVKKAQREGTLSHLAKLGGEYGDFSDVPSLLDAHARLQRGEQIYRELPSELRREFPDQFAFFSFVTDPQNSGRLSELLPALAKPGSQRPDVVRTAASMANPAIVDPPPEPPAAAPTPPAGGDASSST